ncbi:MAG TPA: 2-amino-4-hydroxy-6-hydroxymethyldihydropteridine diphosphokinase [Fibrobacteria bacterium]|jgi:2-amino-4-hydroxy-6-hydroxymethyldihydropteridine diphosphokinase|nr:2-amino-4-hydroxy-6-hydroxymethyldihydropteridine diphosphokinase [Fibrobacteria bacterium]
MAANEKTAWLALGSNIGDRPAHLRRALESLRGIAGATFRVSKIYETEPVGPGPQDPYLNLCIRLSTALNPRQLLEFCKETEVRLGRIPRGRWEPREIDIDILAYEGVALNEGDLILPHPGLAERQFVLVPLAEIDPEAVLPGFRESVTRMLQRCREAQGDAGASEYRLMPQGPSATLPDRLRYVAVEGVIGAGKTTLVRLLGERLGAQTLYEEFENNPFLADFYRDRSRFAFQTQIFFLLSRFRQIQDYFQQQDLFRPQVVSDYMFAKDRIFATQNLDENEMGLYQHLSALMERQIPRPDYVVYLQADTSVLMERIRRRDRDYERNMDEEYIESLNQAYNGFFHYYDASPLLIVNTNHIDFVRREDDLNLLVDQILKAPEGVTYWSPGEKH